MGLSAPLLAALGAVARSHRLRGHLLALGVQTIRCDGEAAARAIAGTLGSCRRLPQQPDDRSVYAALGFERSTSIDLFADESPDRILDLSQPFPQDFVGAFDAFLDAGTLEHVFDAPLALRSLIASLAPGGVAIHISPMDGFGNHGFFQFGPKLFSRLYAANAFVDLTAWRIALSAGDNDGRVEPILDCDAPLAPSRDGERTLVLFAARRAKATPFLAPVDTHVAGGMAAAASLMQPATEVLEGMRALGFAPRRGWRLWRKPT